jgi:20S proteasome alpha/beta subunit
MTLQVALVGKDGIVVASDKKHADTSSRKRRTFPRASFE